MKKIMQLSYYLIRDIFFHLTLRFQLGLLPFSDFYFSPVLFFLPLLQRLPEWMSKTIVKERTKFGPNLSAGFALLLFSKMIFIKTLFQLPNFSKQKTKKKPSLQFIRIEKNKLNNYPQSLPLSP